MLASVTLENFFSFRERTKITLNPGVNMLVGINGSGKSNLIKAIRLLHEFVTNKNFDRYLYEQFGNLREVSNYGMDVEAPIRLSFEFDLRLKHNTGMYSEKWLHIFDTHFSAAGSGITYKFDIIPSLNNGFSVNEKIGFTSDLPQLHNSVNSIGHPYLFRASNRLTIYDNVYEEYLKPDVGFRVTERVLDKGLRNSCLASLGQSSLFIDSVLEVISSLHLYDFFATQTKGLIRRPGVHSFEGYLLPTGENLISVLQKMQSESGDSGYKTIIKEIKKVNPHFEDLTISEKDGFLHLSLVETGLPKPVSILNVSDGTLRFLLLLTILCSAHNDAVICLDEPESGLHPDMISSVAEGIRHASKSSQVLVATHSPLLLNAFNLDEVIIFEKDESNQTIVKALTEDDLAEVDRGTLTGLLWLRGMIGGKRW